MRTPWVGVVAALVLAAALLACDSAGDGGAATDTAAGGGGDGAAADVALGGGSGDGTAAPDTRERVAPQRIAVEEARARMLSDERETLLVCAYQDPASCADKLLEGAITLLDLQGMRDAGELALDRELIFYCS